MKINLTLFLYFFIAITILWAQSSSQRKDNAITSEILIDSLTNALDRIYIFPEKSKLMGDHLKRLSKKGEYKNINDPELLAERISRDIQAVHRDGHLRIHYDPEFSARIQKAPQLELPQDRQEEVNRAKAENFSFKKLEILNGNIGYIQFQGFIGFIEEAKPTITAAFRFLSNTNAIIVDLRKNGGGSPWMVKQIASYFYQERTRLNDIYERRNNKTMEFYAEPEAAENMRLAMPVYILTSKNTFSAAEDFTYAMQVNKRAMIIGDTTGGGAHPTGPVNIGQGFVVDIPFARSINHITKTDWEGTGVLPDVPVAADQALVTAQKLALEAQLTKAKTPEQKKQIGWLIEALNVHDYDNTVNVQALKKYTGVYGQFSISIKEGQFYLHDFHGRTFNLKPISGTLFLADDWLQVEFVLERENSLAIKLLGKAGWEDVYAKTK